LEVPVSVIEFRERQETEAERVERWRAEELERAGYDMSAVAVLAASPEVDLHLAIDLLRSGCSQDVAMQILL
jgi:hypothetical protein